MASLGDGQACGRPLGLADVRGLLQKGLVVLGQPVRHGMAAQHEGEHDGCLLQGSLGHLVSSFWHFASAAVVWGESARWAAADTLLTPLVLAEVLSPSSQFRDRAYKMEIYKQIPDLTDYLIVSASRVYVEHFRRGESEGEWW
ncbi:MAG: Uma2 family endonuclease, partial [Rubrivivax sp.]